MSWYDYDARESMQVLQMRYCAGETSKNLFKQGR